MALDTRYQITDHDVSEIRSFPVLTELPYFMRHHKRRLRYLDEMVAVVSNRKHVHPTFVHLNAFHRHQTPYAAVDALAPALAEFFEHTDILPIVEPIFERFRDRLAQARPALYKTFAERGILIPRAARE